MTNPFAIITLHAIDSYNKAMANSPSQHTLPKGLFMFSIGTAIFATLMYKVTRTGATSSTATAATSSTASATASTATTWSNFLSRFFNHYIAAEEQASKDADIPFEDKYFKEYDEWVAAQDAAEAAATAQDADTDTATDTAAQAHKKECLENMLYVRETINDFYGDIIMRYDAAIFSFVYYARTANIPYKYLETVSRKYMIETNAPRDIHVDIRKEYAKAKEHLTNKKVSSNAPQAAAAAAAAADDNDTKQEPDVFAKFKTYNTAPNISNTNQNSTKTTTTTESTNNTSTKVMRENANRYSYRGKLAEWATAGPAVAPVTDATATATADATTATPADATASQANETYAEYKKRMRGVRPRQNTT